VTFPVLASNGPSGYNLSRSLRFRSSASAYLSRTPSVAATSNKIFTISFWAKPSLLVPLSYIWFLDCAGQDFGFYYNASYTAAIQQNAGANYITTSQVFRDPAAWYHFVLAVDTTQATAANRIKLYVNGSQVTAFSGAAYPPQNTTFLWNQNGQIQYIGRNSANASILYDGYFAEFYSIDGQQLPPSSFGSTNALTGVWQPARYTGTYGTNGFYLPFTDNSGATSTTIGKDFSGNSNNWTPNNISVTAGTTYDSMTDVPTLTSATAANFCTLNPLSTTAGTYSNANLRYVGASAWRRTNSTAAFNSGKLYWEVKLGNAPYTPKGSNTSYNAFGFGLSTVFNSTTTSSAVTDAIILGDNGYYKNFSGAWTDSGLTFISGDVLSVAVDLTANTFTFYRNNSSVVTGTIGVTAGTTLTPIVLSYDGTYGVMDANFGQRPFTYTPPAGFVALNTYNLPDSTIVKGNTVMDATLYTGNGAASQVITNAAGFRPDFVWGKPRSGADQHWLTDAVRGVGSQLNSNSSGIEITNQTTTLLSLNSNGYTVGASTNLNRSGFTFVGWQWLESASAGFDIVTFTGNGGGQTFAHGLGVAPGLMICKSRNNAQDWYVYHSSIGGTGALSLNTTAATATSVNYWSNVTPSSGTFSVGGNFSNGYTYVNYLFAPIAGFSAFGSYTGNGSSDGTFVYLGFRPKFVMMKRTTGVGNWFMYDTARSTFNLASVFLYANLSDAEVSDTANGIDMLSNGFKLRVVGNFQPNTSGETFIYAAFAENPFKNALAR
jgi:hypothetical protein